MPALWLRGPGRGRRQGNDNPRMSSPKVLFGFHAVGVRLKTAPQSIIEIYYEATRRDARMRQFLDRAKEAGARLIEADSVRIAKLAGSHGHQGVAARVEPVGPDHLAGRSCWRTWKPQASSSPCCWCWTA